MGSLDRSYHGSSPLTRGAREDTAARAGLRGLIPAHAGSTPRLRFSSFVTKAHPRSRGEHAVDPLDRAHKRGSSPLTRGAPANTILTVAAVGLIPAHAGSTMLDRAVRLGGWAHPRSRGEHGTSIN